MLFPASTMLSRSAFVSRNVGFGFGRSCLRSTVRAAGGAIEERQRSRARSFATDPSGSAPIVGCGSNVVDLFYRVKELPKPGDKGYFSFASPLVDTVVGGVTLNHLCWARALGAPTGLMALQGEDDNGRTIRAALKERDVSTSTVRVSPEYGTSVSHVFVDECVAAVRTRAAATVADTPPQLRRARHHHGACRHQSPRSPEDGGRVCSCCCRRDACDLGDLSGSSDWG